MKIFLSLVYGLGLLWNLVFIGYNITRLPLANLLFPLVVMLACGVNLYFLWTKKQESD